LINPLADNRLAHCWNLSPIAALDRAVETFGPNIHIEAGISIVNQLINAGRVDFLELSVTPIVGGEDVIDIDELLSHFTIVSDETLDGTRFISAESRVN
jgi:dihydrofolate reductase